MIIIIAPDMKPFEDIERRERLKKLYYLPEQLKELEASLIKLDQMQKNTLKDLDFCFKQFKKIKAFEIEKGVKEKKLIK